ncbi:MAG: sialidase family protein [Bacteroidota bacterium]
MKKQFELSGKTATFIVISVIAYLFSYGSIQAQVVFPNIQVNDLDSADASPDGYKSITVIDDTVYVVWTDKRNNHIPNIFFSKSIDGGQSFSTDIQVYNGPDSIGHVAPSVAVDEWGVIYVAWTALSNNDQYWNIWMAKSVDGGSSFQTPQIITNTNSFFLPSVGLFNNNIYVFYADLAGYPYADYYFSRSVNGGASFETPVQVNDVPCVSEVSDFISAMTVDASGNIYLAWVDGRRTNSHGDICFAKSTNNGVSFSSNVIVNDISSIYADSVQYMPSIAVGSANKVYITFTDQRLGNDDWPSNRVYLSVSDDGGSTFAPEVLLAGHDDICKFHDITASTNDKISVAICSNVVPYGWAIWLFESFDGGINFAAPVALCDTLNNSYSDLRMFMTSDENVYAVWKDERIGMGLTNVYFS